MVKWLSCLPSKQAARVRFPFGVLFFLAGLVLHERAWMTCMDLVSCVWPHCAFFVFLAPSLLPFSISMHMRQPQLKRRRLLSNSLVPLLTPNLLAASLKHSNLDMYFVPPNDQPQIQPTSCLCKVCRYSLCLDGLKFITLAASLQMQRINVRHLCADMYR